MATNRTQRTRNRTSKSGITEDAYQYYTGGDWLGGEDFAEGKTPAEIRTFWDAHKCEILERYDAEMREKRRKGDRPWYWWDHEMPEPQREIPKPANSYDANKVRNYQTGDYGWYETDLEYLQRLGLLRDWEK